MFESDMLDARTLSSLGPSSDNFGGHASKFSEIEVGPFVLGSFSTPFPTRMAHKIPVQLHRRDNFDVSADFQKLSTRKAIMS